AGSTTQREGRRGMTAPKQRTLANAATIEGVGLHTGAPARVHFVPAGEHHGVVFRRTDLPGQPTIAARLEQVVSTDRGTTLAQGEARVSTVEHLLAAVGALQLDNLMIEIDGPEVPIVDGSFRLFLETLGTAGAVEQHADARVLELRAPVQASAD